MSTYHHWVGRRMASLTWRKGKPRQDWCHIIAYKICALKKQSILSLVCRGGLWRWPLFWKELWDCQGICRWIWRWPPALLQRSCGVLDFMCIYIYTYVKIVDPSMKFQGDQNILCDIFGWPVQFRQLCSIWRTSTPCTAKRSWRIMLVGTKV